MNSSKVYLLRVVHGCIAAYFLACLVYVYYAAFAGRFELFFPAKKAKQAIPVFATLTWIALALIVIRFGMSSI